MDVRPRRSALYMPASNARAIEKARSIACDIVILDLEDAVAPEMKAAARAQAIGAVHAGGFGRRELVVRTNALDTDWGHDDLAALATAGVDGVLLPKVSDPVTLRAARAVLGDGPALWAMIETCRAIASLDAIVDVAAETGLEMLVVGTNDLAKEMRCRPGADRAPLLSVLTRIVLAARIAGIAVLDGVCNAIDDPAVLRAECEQGLSWGFDGKTLIHPSQVESANAVFAPSAAEIAWAHTVIDAFALRENAAKGAIRIDGKMVELLHRDEAERTIAMAAACSHSGGAAL